MTISDERYSYGPVPSRRLGKSLGINNIPPKYCTYSCVYCQVGRTMRMPVERSFFYDPEAVFRDVQARVSEARLKDERIDYLTFVPDGEPTLDINLGSEIELVKKLGIPVGVITNSSLLYRDDVKRELEKADWVSLKIDTVDERLWRRTNRPHRTLRLGEIMGGISAFVKTFSGILVTETMLVGGLNDGDDRVKEVADFVVTLNPRRAYVSVPIRPPAEKWVHSPEDGTVNRAYQIFAERVKDVEYLIGYEGDTFVFTGEIEKDLMSITAVHPLREEAVRVLLDRADFSWEIVDWLVARGDLVRTEYNGHTFYLRRFAEVR